MEPLRRLFSHASLAEAGSADLYAERPPSPQERMPSDNVGQEIGLHWGPPVSLRSVFSPIPGAATQAAHLSDSELPSTSPSVYLASTAMRRSSRLDESAGEGLRRSVLVRNAMLSSLERERLSPRPPFDEPQQALRGELGAQGVHPPLRRDEEDRLAIRSAGPSKETHLSGSENGPEVRPSTSSREHFEREVQWFEDLLSELGSNDEEATAIEYDDDFVAVELPDEDSVAADEVAQLEMGAEAVSTFDSGFAERRSPSSSTASGPRLGYPYICPYPSTAMLAGSVSSEELPALVEDNSDAEDDDDDDDEEDDQDENVTPLAEPEGNPLAEALLSRPLSPVEAVERENALFAGAFSPPSTRPGSPTLSSSSKGDSEQSSPNGACENLSNLSLLSELAMRSAATRGRHGESLDLALARICGGGGGSNFATLNIDTMALAAAPAQPSQPMPPRAPPVACRFLWQTSADQHCRGQYPCCSVVREFGSSPSLATASCGPSISATALASGNVDSPMCCTMANDLGAVRRGQNVVNHWSAA
ncbi:uncharacterized protein PFL1_00051 [Pseudozyma flocculosa PF-1]|uniref:Uncharacterized protein n=1 Tax=Pseudozyma flocculosa TaxID=84751 RepID=A0A5C3ESL5_9BASI|nr:uncharacterized protein PFL1_00051 [Pseudozyma flocculosa PF-1]EPQ31852.1 hypothetical protein PFL1_00051 [Pseudozyma flocculosa PF-1]SPO35248.1 uncharacterized protein PSFLO_00719 [Pseudozyma flocculosa]